jgi:hypothetical protein
MRLASGKQWECQRQKQQTIPQPLCCNPQYYRQKRILPSIIAHNRGGAFPKVIKILLGGRGRDEEIG